MKKQFFNLSLNIPYEVEISIPSSVRKVFLLLHGFKQDGKQLFDQISAILPDDVAIIAPNGPFFIPVQNKNNFEMKYAWYFFDPLKKSYYINYDPAAEFIKSILIELDLFKMPITIIGYSQGGYLAPKIAEIVPSVESVIGLACVFRNHMFDFRSSVFYHQIQSKSDTIIDFEGAKEEFLVLKNKGNIGRFIELDGLGHRLSNEYLFELSELI